MLLFSESDYSSSFDDQELFDLNQIVNATDNDKNIGVEWGDVIKVSFYLKKSSQTVTGLLLGLYSLCQSYNWLPCKRSDSFYYYV